MNGETPAKSIKIMEFAEETLRSWVKDDGKLREACTAMDDWPEDRDLGPPRMILFSCPLGSWVSLWNFETILKE